MPDLIPTAALKAAMDAAFLGPGAACKIALFTSALAPTAAGTPDYTAMHEASGAGYTAGAYGALRAITRHRAMQGY